MKILLLYASTDGQTRKIVRFCADQLFSQGHSVEMLRAEDAGDLELARFDAAVLAGSVHVGNLQSILGEVAGAHANALNEMPTVLLQVSLAAAGGDEGERAELDNIAQRFCEAAGWTPGAIHQVAGAFRFTEYDFFKSWAMRFIAAQKGEEIDPHRDKEYTDWDALSELMHGWP